MNISTNRSMLAILVLALLIATDGEAAAPKPANFVLKAESFRPMVEDFNKNDRELYRGYYPNTAAWDFLEANIPLLDCPDEDIQRTYYFRWWTYRKHIKQTPDGFIVDEFLPPVDWAGKYNSISCAAGHHLYEGRWLKAPNYMDDYSIFWFRKGGEPRRYSFWAANAIWARYCVSGNKSFTIELLPDLMANYEAWEKSNRDTNGLYWQSDDRDGMEVSIGGSGYRATINSYQFGDALAIAQIAELAGKTDIAREYRGKAAAIKRLVEAQLWDADAQFFKVLPRGENKPLAKVREQHGFTPWYFNLPGPQFAVAWKQVMDPQGFYAPFGPTTAEQRHPQFALAYAGHECQWNGPSWPYATAITLTGLANLLNGPPQDAIGARDYFELLRIYTKSHQLKLDDGRVVPWIDENLNPGNGDWISRTRLKTWKNGTWDAGKGGEERGKDYSHSTYCDLVITGLIGLRPRPDETVEVNPLVPLAWDAFCLDRIHYHGHSLTILWDKTGKRYGKGKGLRVFADGKQIATSANLRRITGLLPKMPAELRLLQSRELVMADAVSANPAGKAEEQARAEDRLSPTAFAEPPVHARPGAFWDWLNGSITREQITRDLEAMKRGGMRGGEIWDVAAYADPDARVPAGPAFLGPESTRLIAHAIRESDRLGLEIGIIASSGWNAGGSWIPPEHAGKGIYQSITTVTGPRAFHGELPLPELPKLCPRDSHGRPIYLREVAVLAVPHDKSQTLADMNQVVDLTKRIDADGKLRWEVPAGDWDILRFVCANHGQQLIVPSPNSGGPMIDFFDPRATEFHLHHILTTILKELGRKSFEGTSFKTLEFDSMELDGFTPWNDVMAAEFQRRTGYPVLRFLPVLAGWKLADHQVQEQFLYDWRKLVSDQLIDSHYATARKILGSYGLKLIAESGGPGPPIWDSNPVDGIKALGVVDIPRGEFWNRHREIFLIKEIASAAHVYDKRLVSAESFTTWRRWIDGPLNHKQLADRALCEGLNDFAFHTFASSPPEAGLPGWAYHAGTDINPSATWWPMVRSLTDYLARCSYLLRQGWFVADVCYYYGDQAPNFYPPLCNVPEKPLLEGLDPRHDYDVCSSEVILRRMRVGKGRIVLPDGMSYAALVLPEQDHIPAEVLAKIRALVVDGATVIGHLRPTRAPGIKDQQTKTGKVERLAEELWGQSEGAEKPGQPSVLIRPIGKGRFIIASDRSAALRKIGVPGDFEIVGHRAGDLGPLDFIHRKTTEDEFYFIRNTTMDSQTLTCRFRVAAETRGLVPELWWPDSGLRSGCRGWKSLASGQTELPLALGPSGSVFVVFRKAGAALDPCARDTFVAAETPAPLTLDGPWQVEFPEGWGAPQMTTFATLRSWTESDNEGIRFFSGIATYRKTFELPELLAKQDRLFLELGDLAEIAEVTLNGKRLGLAWLPPYRIDISGAAHSGANQLEIRVANLWANRLNGDSLLPESDRFTRSNLDRIQTDPTSDSSYGRVPRGKTRPVYDKIPPLMKSGLFGPIRLITPGD